MEPHVDSATVAAEQGVSKDRLTVYLTQEVLKEAAQTVFQPINNVYHKTDMIFLYKLKSF
jgi:hypothetical protein